MFFTFLISDIEAHDASASTVEHVLDLILLPAGEVAAGRPHAAHGP